MQLEPWILGIPHPTGFPAFVLLGWLFSHLVPFGNPAWRMGLFSAAAMAGACATLALFLDEFEVPPWAAVFGAWIFGFGDIAWTRGSRTEVQALAIFFTGLTLLYAVRWLRTRDPRDGIVAAAAWGCGLATHPVTIFLAPGLLCIALVGRQGLTMKRALAFLGAAAVPLVMYAFIPLRSAYLFAVRRDPTLDLGLAPGRPFWDTNHAAGGLSSYLDAAPGQIGGGVLGVFAPSRWAPVSQQYFGSLSHEFGIVAVFFGILGFAFALRERPLLWGALIVGVGLTVPFILNYPEADFERYFLGTFWLFAAAIAIGVYRGLRAYARHALFGSALAGIVLAGLLAVISTSNAGTFGQRDDTSGADFVRRVIAATPSNAIVVSEWTYVTPLAYESYAESDFGDRIVVSGWPTDYIEYYKKWLKKRPLYVHAFSLPLVLPAESGLVATNLDTASNMYQVELAPGAVGER